MVYREATTEHDDPAIDEEEHDHPGIPEGTILLERFRIVGRIGEGGFADVYEAEQLDSGRRVAVKILHQVDGEKRRRQIRKRFVREAELVAQIKHPDVVELFDFGVTEDGRLLFAMELMEGKTLEDELEANGGMEVARAMRLMIRCLSGLQAAHQLGVVHRDLKPANLFLDEAPDGSERLRILDFGIAFVGDDPGNRLTRTGQIQGTPQYLAPEYIQAQLVVPALDVYQMGLILAEMITGLPVVNEDNPYKCLMAHASGQLKLDVGIMLSKLGPVLTKALAANHVQRFQNAAEFQQAMIPLVKESGTIANEINAHRSQKSEPRRSPTQSGAAKRHMPPVQIQVRPKPSQPAPLAESRDAGGSSSSIKSARERAQDRLSDDFPLDPPRSRGLVIALITVAAALAVAAFALVAIGVGGDDVERIFAHTSAEVADGGSADTAAEPSEPVVAEPVSVQVRIAPDTARILHRGDELGVGKTTISFENREAKPVRLRVINRGYKTRIVTVTPGDAPFMDVKLTAKPKKGRRK